MVQGVLVVQEALVVLLSERIGGKERERRVYFCIRRNIWAKSESDGQVLQRNPKSVLTLHPSGPLPSWVDSEELGIRARLFGKPL